MTNEGLSICKAKSLKNLGNNTILESLNAFQLGVIVSPSVFKLFTFFIFYLFMSGCLSNCTLVTSLVKNYNFFS